MNRSEFLRTAAAATAAFGLNKTLRQGDAREMSENPASSNPASIPRREYCKTGVKLSIIGFGGIVIDGAEQGHANRVVAEAVERGVNYFDVAPTYGDAELIMGPALEPYRKNVFLACKTTQREREGAEAELKRSLERLRTDHFDLYQLHSIQSVEKDVDVAFRKGGAMEVFIEAKKSGQVRHIGFSAHSVEAALAAMDRYDFDSALFPINFACYFKGNFGSRIIETAQSKGVTCLALKALARQRWPKEDPNKKKYSKCWYQPITDPHEADICFRFTLSQPITAAIPPGDEELFRRAIDLAMKFKPITPQEEREVKALAAKMNPIFRAG
jgi:aryl-alcohol dehydrogenase-like predicted oxidoreductase